jgi:hypothetical protein
MSKIIELEKRYLRALKERLVLNHTTSDYKAYNRQLERLNVILEIEKKVNDNI